MSYSRREGKESLYKLLMTFTAGDEAVVSIVTASYRKQDGYDASRQPARWDGDGVVASDKKWRFWEEHGSFSPNRRRGSGGGKGDTNIQIPRRLPRNIYWMFSFGKPMDSKRGGSKRFLIYSGCLHYTMNLWLWRCFLPHTHYFLLHDIEFTYILSPVNPQSASYTTPIQKYTSQTDNQLWKRLFSYFLPKKYSRYNWLTVVLRVIGHGTFTFNIMIHSLL